MRNFLKFIALRVKLERLSHRIRFDPKLKYINSGGCGVLAAAVGDAMLKLTDPAKFDVDCVVLNYYVHPGRLGKLIEWFQTAKDLVEIGTVKNRVKEWRRNNVDFAHIVARLTVKASGNQYIFDSDFGFVPKAKFEKLEQNRWSDPVTLGSMSVKMAAELAADRSVDAWNPMFFNILIPYVKSLVKEELLA